MSSLNTNYQIIAQQLKLGAHDFLILLRSPADLWLGLKIKWLVPVLLLTSLLLVPLVLQPCTDFLLEAIYPPVEKSQLFGLINTSHTDEHLETRKVQAAVILWLLALAGVGGGLLGYAPEVKRAVKDRDLADVEPGALAFGEGGRYRVLEELGAGAMGVVYAAHDNKLQRKVALKVLSAALTGDRERRERFRREALTLAQLSHPGIVQVYDLLEEQGQLLLVLELVRGGTLEDFIVQRVPLAVAEASSLLTGICAALEYLRQKEIVHRDLKPANILLDEKGVPKVTDFGMARLRNSGITLEGSVIGTPRYMSPEQAAGLASDYRSDIYALGTIFYEMLSGKTPYDGEATAVLLQQAAAQPIPALEGYAAEVVDLASVMLIKEPEKRASDFREIQARLQALAG